MSKHRVFLLAPDYVRCVPHPQFGAELEPDFILLRPAARETECVLVEIEPSETPLFTKDGDVTARVNHALRQVSDWRAWLRENVAYARSSLGLPNLHSECRAFVIVGRSAVLTGEERGRLANLNLERNGKTEVLTYDDLRIRLVALTDNLRMAGKRYVSPKKD